ncbi:hypothetical protein [Micromonospora sp. NPDC049171]|uniref:hypothetical protein n=1 Tax=Micromonospora sp. NPDC049171 TaxID=3155770 RepID=UPI0034088EB1
MSLLTIGNRSLELRVAKSAPPSLRHFVTRITRAERPTGQATQSMHVCGGDRTRLIVDTCKNEVLLELAANLPGGQATLEIGILQAAARSMAVMGNDDLALLHGSAITTDEGKSAVAVLDGGRGQGKTSLALGLAARGGSLLVDEFAFTVVRHDQPCIVPMPTMPWHLRADMAALLVPGAAERLLYPVDLPAGALAEHRPVPLSLIVIPDHGLPAGELREAPAPAGRDLLRAAVTDHEAKLRNPRLDHVSIFDSPDDVSIGRNLCGASRDEKMIEALSAVPIVRAGIGKPHDLPASVMAVSRRIAGGT